MATNKPIGDNARKGAVRKRSQLKANLKGATRGSAYPYIRAAQDPPEWQARWVP